MTNFLTEPMNRKEVRNAAENLTHKMTSPGLHTTYIRYRVCLDQARRNLGIKEEQRFDGKRSIGFFWIPASSTSAQSKVTPEIPSSAAGFDSQVSAPNSEAPKKRCPRHKDNEYIPVAEGRNLCQACYEKEKHCGCPKNSGRKHHQRFFFYC